MSHKEGEELAIGWEVYARRWCFGKGLQYSGV